MTSFDPYVAHPIAEWFPLLDEPALAEMAASIAREGQLEPCVVWGSQLVDGRNRWLACERAGVEPRVVSREFRDDSEAGRWIVAQNVHRRHLTTSQRAMLAARALPLYEEPARERQREAASEAAAARPRDEAGRLQVPANLPEPGAVPRHEREARSEAASAFNVSPRAVQAAKAVATRGVPELAQAVADGEVSVSAAEQVTKLARGEQAEVVAAGPEAVREVAAEIRRAANFTSLSDLWFTPSAVVEAARVTLGGFDLDPASCEEANATVRATQIYTQADDGLVHDWHGRVWCNPPYGRDSEHVSNQAKWSAYMADQYDAGKFVAGCLLVTFVPDRGWFERLWNYPMCAFRDRLKFRVPGGNVPDSPTSANVVVYFGRNIDAFARAFSRFGRILVPRGAQTEVLDAAA